MKWFILIAAIVFNALANILIKMGMSGESQHEDILNMLKSKWLSLPIIGGIICFGFALVAYSYVLSRMNLSIAYPIMTSAGFMLIGIASWLIFKETITQGQVIGFVCIVFGIWMVAK